jgi:hypothetical protein
MTTILTPSAKPISFRDAAQAANRVVPIHRWVPWVAGYSAGFVSDIFDHYLGDRADATVLDPFTGVGTTLIEAQMRGWKAIGFEINAYASLASKVKLSASGLDPDGLEVAIESYRLLVGDIERRIDSNLGVGAPRATSPGGFRTRIPFFSVPIEQKVLHSIDFIEKLEPKVASLFRLAFASVMVSFSNYSYEPSLSTRPASGKPLIEHASVVDAIAGKLTSMLTDIREIDFSKASSDWQIHDASFMDEGLARLQPNSVDLLLTSPPYLNNYHYVRNTRPQMYWLGYAESARDLRKLEETNFGRFWQMVRELEPIGLQFESPELEAKIDEIRSLNPERGSYGGNGWANYAATYYNDVYRCLGVVAEVMKPGGVAVFVVGNSVIQGVHLPIDEHFSSIGALHGLVTDDIHVVREKRVGSSIVNSGLRTRTAKPTRLYDAATVLRKP